MGETGDTPFGFMLLATLPRVNQSFVIRCLDESHIAPEVGPRTGGTQPRVTARETRVRDHLAVVVGGFVAMGAKDAKDAAAGRVRVAVR